MTLFATLTPEQRSSFDSMAGLPPVKVTRCGAGGGGGPCTTMVQVVDRLCELFSRVPKEGLIGLKGDIIELLRSAVLPEADWAKYAKFNDQVPYSRNLVATDNKNFTLLVLCWNPAFESKIHDHPCDGCYVKVLKNSVKETRYHLTHDGEVIPYQEIEAKEGTVTYMHDNLGLHKIGNPHPTEGSVSLHVYTPPFQSCKIWCEPGRQEPSIGTMTFQTTNCIPIPQPPALELHREYSENDSDHSLRLQ